MEYNYDYFKKSADYVKAQIGDFQPEIGIILGSGLNRFADHIENRMEVAYKDIPNFLVSTAPFHAGKLYFGEVEGKKLVCMSGRFHFYEGYDMEQLTAPIRLMKLLGVKAVISTCAAGGINESYKTGDIMIISDHIKMNCSSPLRGKNIDEFGERFFDMSNAYDRDLRRIARECESATSLRVQEGVYFFFTGPQYETPAEIRAARILGGDAAGMSTVTECLTAAHCRLPFLGIALISNMAAGVTGAVLSCDEVGDVGNRLAPEFEKYIRAIVRKM